MQTLAVQSMNDSSSDRYENLQCCGIHIKQIAISCLERGRSSIELWLPELLPIPCTYPPSLCMRCVTRDKHPLTNGNRSNASRSRGAKAGLAPAHTAPARAPPPNLHAVVSVYAAATAQVTVPPRSLSSVGNQAPHHHRPRNTCAVLDRGPWA